MQRKLHSKRRIFSGKPFRQTFLRSLCSDVIRYCWTPQTWRNQFNEGTKMSYLIHHDRHCGLTILLLICACSFRCLIDDNMQVLLTLTVLSVMCQSNNIAMVFEGFENFEGSNTFAAFTRAYNNVYVQGGPMPTNYSDQLTTLTSRMLTLEFEQRPTANQLLQSGILRSHRWVELFNSSSLSSSSFIITQGNMRV